MRDDYTKLKTEAANPRTAGIDKMSTIEMVRVMNEENRRVPEAIDAELPHIAAAIDLIADALRAGGHLIYVGAGTSGRLGVVDASECPPTFGVGHDLVRGIIAGGEGAMFRAVEGAEDNEALGASELLANGAAAGDVVVGLSAAGRAPYVLGALREAKRIGAATVGITCNPDSLLAPLCDVTIAPAVGPEVIAGSTRLGAGTAQKLVLNMLSTGAMIRLGYVRGNRMINVRPTNEKLRERAIHIIMDLAEVDHDTAARVLIDAGDSIPAALILLGVE